MGMFRIFWPDGKFKTTAPISVNYRANFDTSADRREAHVLKGCIKNCSIVKLAI